MVVERLVAIVVTRCCPSLTLEALAGCLIQSPLLRCINLPLGRLTLADFQDYLPFVHFGCNLVLCTASLFLERNSRPAVMH
jgi:hypothetical protein